jgi:hypothetical protein
MRENIDACRILVGKPEGKNHLEDLGVEGKIIIKYIFKKWDGGVYWIHLAQNSDKWWASLKRVINSGVHKMLGVSWLDKRLLSSEEGLSSTELVN